MRLHLTRSRSYITLRIIVSFFSLFSGVSIFIAEIKIQRKTIFQMFPLRQSIALFGVWAWSESYWRCGCLKINGKYAFERAMHWHYVCCFRWAAARAFYLENTCSFCMSTCMFLPSQKSKLPSKFVASMKAGKESFSALFSWRMRKIICLTS